MPEPRRRPTPSSPSNRWALQQFPTQTLCTRPATRINLTDFPQHAEDNAPSLANPTKQVTTITLEMENKASGDAKE